MKELETFVKDGRLSPVTGETLVELIQRKKEKDKYDRFKFFSGSALLLLLGGLLFQFYGLHGAANGEAYGSAALQLLERYAFIVIPAFLIWQYSLRQYREADEDYEALRAELIDRSEELWLPHGDVQIRTEILALLDEHHGINLYYKS